LVSLFSLCAISCNVENVARSQTAGMSLWLTLRSKAPLQVKRSLQPLGIAHIHHIRHRSASCAATLDAHQGAAHMHNWVNPLKFSAAAQLVGMPQGFALADTLAVILLRQ